MRINVLIRPEAVGGYSISVPVLPGCNSEGDSREEALASIREAAELWLAATTENAKADVQATEADPQEIEL